MAKRLPAASQRAAAPRRGPVQAKKNSSPMRKTGPAQPAMTLADVTAAIGATVSELRECTVEDLTEVMRDELGMKVVARNRVLKELREAPDPNEELKAARSSRQGAAAAAAASSAAAGSGRGKDYFPPGYCGPTVKQAKKAVSAYILHLNAHPGALRDHYTDASGALLPEQRAELEKTKKAVRALGAAWRGLKDSTNAFRRVTVMTEIEAQHHRQLNFQWGLDPTRRPRGGPPPPACTNAAFAAAAPPDAQWLADGSGYTVFEPLEAELALLKLGALNRRARRAGVDEGLLEAAMDDEDCPAIASLIVAKTRSAGRADVEVPPFPM
eukprot:COSAG01_NODE_18603_length_1065_cov_0.873706_2_plen_325_part_01